MYTINESTGIVTLDSTGVQVAPAQSVDDPDYVAYIAWVNAGNTPTVYQPTVTPANRQLTQFEFRMLFTLAERVAIDNVQDNTNISTADKEMMKTLQKDFELADYIDLDDPEAELGINFITSIGLITPERAIQIKAGEVPVT